MTANSTPIHYGERFYCSEVAKVASDKNRIA